MKLTLAALQAEAVSYFNRVQPNSLASDALASVVQLSGHSLQREPSDRIAQLAGILTTLLFAANETGLSDLHAYRCNCTSALQALNGLRRDAHDSANADTVARCFANYWELLRLSGVWQSQVKTVAWRRLQAKVVH